VKRVSALIALAALAVVARAENVPLPRPRPFIGTDAVIPKIAGTEAAPSACRLRLTADRAVAPSIESIHGPEECGGIDLVRLAAVVLPDNGGRVEITPPAVLRCGMAEAIVDWVREDLSELVDLRFGSRLRSVQTHAAYNCRGRNNVPGAILSEHGKANALDLGSITLLNGKRIDPVDTNLSGEIRASLKTALCSRFSTVLGPGSDEYHENHLHLDLRERRNGYRICQWEIRIER
jgi:hypothetical protein